uniref:MFS domain-containing protein n=1 Tax=Meloidogyne hapla TaxID=6305 RepID=A0A1I8AYI9_MELHA
MGLFVCLGYTFRLLSHLDERRCITFSLIVMLGFFLSTYPWPFLTTPMPLPTFVNETLANSTVVQTVVTQGCSPQKYSWCLTTPAINAIVYHAALVFTLGIAAPIGNINLDVLYSRLLGPIKQGTMQGVFVALSDLVGFAGPVIVTNVYQWGGPKPVWAGIIGLIGSGIAFWMYFYERLVPKYRTVQMIDKVKKKHLS